MKHYEVTIILEDEKQQQRIDALEERFKKYNGWSAQDILQFAVAAFPKVFDTFLSLMELKADEMNL